MSQLWTHERGGARVKPLNFDLLRLRLLGALGAAMSRAGGSGRDSFPAPQMKDYLLSEALGSGTYATVYKAIHKVIELVLFWCPDVSG